MKRARGAILNIAAGAALSLLLAPPLAAAPAQPASASPTRLYPASRLVQGDRISVEIVGKGPDLVLIPGLASSRETWRRTADRLKDRYRLHLVQVDGFAGEPAGANATGPVFDPVADAIAAYLGKLEHPLVVGHSLGGTLGLAIAERHPGLVSRLMLVDTLPFYGVIFGGPDATPEKLRPMVDGIRARPAAPMPDEAAGQMAAQMVTAPEDAARLLGWMKASDPAVVVAAMTDDMLADLRPGLASVSIPVTILHETALGPAVKAGYAPLPAATLVEVPDAKHFIMYDQPARFDAALDTFLAADGKSAPAG